MAKLEQITVLLGGGGFGNRDPWVAEADISAALEVLAAHNVTKIDTAQNYGSSEAHLGRLNVGSCVNIDTKWSIPEYSGAWASEDCILRTARESIAKLGIERADIFYLHAPDPLTPISSTLAGVQATHDSGLFRRFGLSNFDAQQIVAIHEHCVAQGYILPTVFQGNYNAVSRKPEELLFPTLRKLGMSFIAYGPIAAGLLTKTAAEVSEGKGTHFGDPMYRAMYNRPSYLSALALWESIAREESITKAELAYRWTAWNSELRASHGDGMVVGASSLTQLEETLQGISKGPLTQEACRKINHIWETVKDDATLDTYHPQG
jgi:aflatoxin B1 aldehyde reductase